MSVAEKRRELLPSNHGVDGRKRNLQVGLIRFDFHLYPPLPLPLSLSLD